MIRGLALSLLWIFAAGSTASAQEADESILREVYAMREAAEVGDALWPGFSTAPYSFLLVTEDAEWLLCDSRVPAGFELQPPIAGIDCSLARGPRTWRQPSLLAAMPIFGPGEVIVMGTPAASGRTMPDWRRTIVHEHFHQWQGDLPGVYARIDALDLSGGDETGMWMLEYDFPYDDPEVGVAYAASAAALVTALQARDEEVRSAAATYLAAREAFAASVPPSDWRYYDFQLWKEGVAAWTELAVAERMGGAMAQRAAETRTSRLGSLSSGALADRGRLSAYDYGFAEAALLERVDPDWRGCYRAVLGLTACWESLGLSAGGA